MVELQYALKEHEYGLANIMAGIARSQSVPNVVLQAVSKLSEQRRHDENNQEGEN